MKKLIILCFLFWLIIIAAISQTRDSIVITPRTVVKKVSCDSTYTVYDTTVVRVPVNQTPLRGMYSHPDQLQVGNQISENRFLAYCQNKGVNMINMYSRSMLYSDANRTILAAFVKKAKEQYGMRLITVDVRMTNSNELPGWRAYLSKYNSTISSIEPLTEFEPYVKNDLGIYDYPGFFNLIRTMGSLCKQYGIKLSHYEGWVGNNYMASPTVIAKLKYDEAVKVINDKIAAKITPSTADYNLRSSTKSTYDHLQAIDTQSAVDSMVKYCDRVFISNYVSITDYNSTSTSLGAWDNRMDKRCNAIAVSCSNQNKKTEIVEIVSLEPTFLFSLYQCPGTCKSFYGSAFDKAVSDYKKSTSDILQYTTLIGRTIFYSKYAQQAQP